MNSDDKNGRSSYTFVCTLCGVRATFKTDEYGFKGLHHLFTQAMNDNWGHDTEKIINGTICPCCRSLIELEQGIEVQ